MIRSGIAPLDDRLGGILPGRAFVLSGAPGTGKSVACLEFLNAALDEGGTAAILTHDDPTDLIAQGEFLGMDLDRALRDERLVLLRYQLDFARRFSRAASPDVAFGELRRMLGDRVPARIAIDSIAPFLEGSAASGAGIGAMLRFLDDLGATAMLTYPGDLAGLFDRRLEPLLQRAAAILHLSAQTDRSGLIEIRKVRYTVPSTAPIPFRIQPGTGFAPLATERTRRAEDAPSETRRRVLVLDVAGSVPEDFLTALRGEYDVVVRQKVARAFGDLAQPAAGAIVIGVSRDTVDDALALVREMRRSGGRSPVLLVTPYTLRSEDRARALRAGADDFITGDARPDELLLRVAGAIARGRSPLAPHADVEVPIATMRDGGGAATLLEASAFRNAVDSHVHNDPAPFFTMVQLRPAGAADDMARRALGQAVLQCLRVDGGDLAGWSADGVAVYLHSARRKDVVPFVARVTDQWRRTGRGELAVDVASYPAEQALVHELLSASAA